MLNKKLEEAMNKQINAETYSAYLYMSMAAWFESVQLPGFAHWMKVQAQEEMTHAIRFHNYITERGGRVLLTAIDGPATEWKDPIDCFEAVKAHEQKVTSLINGLVDLAQAEKDHASFNFLQWFVSEQVEEEAGVGEALGQLKLADKSGGGGLFMLDKDMAARLFTWPVNLAPL